MNTRSVESPGSSWQHDTSKGIRLKGARKHANNHVMPCHVCVVLVGRGEQPGRPDDLSDIWKHHSWLVLQ